MKNKLVCLGMVFLFSVAAFLVFGTSIANAAKEKKAIQEFQPTSDLPPVPLGEPEEHKTVVKIIKPEENSTIQPVRALGGPIGGPSFDYFVTIEGLPEGLVPVFVWEKYPGKYVLTSRKLAKYSAQSMGWYGYGSVASSENEQNITEATLHVILVTPENWKAILKSYDKNAGKIDYLPSITAQDLMATVHVKISR